MFQLSLRNPFKPGVNPGVKNEDVVGAVRAVPTGDAPTTSEWSTILLLHNIRGLRVYEIKTFIWLVIKIQ